MKKLHLFRFLFATMLVTAFTAFTGCSEDTDIDFDIPSLEVSTQALAFDENGGEQSFDITTNGAWSIDGAENQNWLTIQPALQGEGSQTIKITTAALASGEAGHSTDLKVSVYTVIYGVNKVVKTETIKVSQTIGGESISDEVIYGNDFDKEIVQKINDRWPYLDQTDVWQNQKGSGIEGVTHESKGASVRTSGASGGYAGASGNNKIFFGSEFVIKDIVLPAGKRSFSLKFGGNFYEFDSKSNAFDTSKFTVAFGNGTAWSQVVEYTKIDGSDTEKPNWILFEAKVTLPEGTEKLSVKFNAKQNSVYSIDDVKLTETIGGTEITFDQEGGEGGDTPAPVGDAIYSNNFDKEFQQKGSDNKWPFLDQTESWKNESGSGISTVTYESKNASVRTSGKLSGNYPNASGNNKIFFGTTPSEMTINTITLPEGKKNFRITFGGNYYNYNQKDNTFYTDRFLVKLGNGSSWSDAITYTKVAGDATTDPYWTQFAADFTLPEGTKTLSIKIEVTEASVFAFDDLVLTEGEGGQQISFDGGSVDPEPQPSGSLTIAEVIKATPASGESTETFTTEGQIIATNGRSFLIKDNSGTILVYQGWNKDTSKPMVEYAAKVGNTVKVTGTTKRFSNLAQFAESQLQIETVKEGTFTQPTASKMDGAAFDAYKANCEAGNPEIKYVEYTGKLTISGFYYNIAVEGTTLQGSLAYPVDGFVDKALDGQNVTVKGYTLGMTNKNSMISTMAVSVTKAGAVDPEPAGATISVNPASLSFVAAGESKEVNVTISNGDAGHSIEASADNAQFTVSVSGTKVTVTAKANETASAVSGNLTVKLMKDGSAVDTKTVALSQAAKAGEGGTGNSVTVEMEAFNYANAEEVTKFTVDPLTFEASIGTGVTTPKYYELGAALRLYQNNTLTITGKTITRIEFTFAEGNYANLETTDGTLTDNIWTGSSSNLQFKVPDVKKTQARIVKMVVTFE